MSKKKQIREFVNENKSEIISYIIDKLDLRDSRPEDFYFKRLNDEDELELWVNNDESLYNWAKSEGVEDE